jgi:hypothetical protein
MYESPTIQTERNFAKLKGGRFPTNWNWNMAVRPKNISASIAG